MSHKSANSQKTSRPKNVLIGPGNLFWPISSDFIWGSQPFHEKSVSHRPTRYERGHYINIRAVWNRLFMKMWTSANEIWWNRPKQVSGANQNIFRSYGFFGIWTFMTHILHFLRIFQSNNRYPKNWFKNLQNRILIQF